MRNFLRTFPAHLIILVALIGFVVIGVIWPLACIELRLSRNGKIARQLVESLESRFPGITFSGGASYEQEVIHIRTNDRPDEAVRKDVEGWLRKQKLEQQISPQIWLDFDHGDFNKAIIIK